MSVSNKVIKDLTGKISGLSKEDQDLLYSILSSKAKDGKISIEVIGDDDEEVYYDKRGQRHTRRTTGRARGRYYRGREKEKATSSELVAGFAGAVNGVVKELFNLGKKLTEAWRQIDDTTTKFARKHGMSGQAESQYRSHSIERYNDLNLGSDFNLSLTEVADLESGLVGATGRRTGVANSDLRNLAGTSKFLGAEQTSSLIGKLDEFGIGLGDATKMAHELYKDSAETGIDLEAYSKNFLDNIEMAQTYNFADGVDGVKSMAKKATELKFSMKSAAAFADKVGNMQGAIETGAKLQSLGGSFAQFSNPLSMMSESLTDTEELYDRMVNMFGDLGKFDRQTGQVKINSVDKRRARAASEAMGVSYEDMMKGATNKARRNEMERALQGAPSNISPELKELLMNTGTFKNGKAGYVNKDGEFKDLSQITEKDQEELKALSRTDSQNMADAALSLKSVNETASGIAKQQEAIKAEIIDKTVGPQLEKLSNILGKDIKPLLVAWASFSMGMSAANAFGGVANIGRNLKSLFKKGKNVPGKAAKGGNGGTSNNVKPKLTGKGKGAEGINDEIKGNTNGKGQRKKAKGRHRNKNLNNAKMRDQTSNAGNSANNVAKGANRAKGVGQAMKGASKLAKGAGVIASVAGLAIDGAKVYDAYKNGGRNEQTEKTSQLTGNAIGTTIGAVFGGPVGAAIGGWIGSTAGKWIGKGINSVTDHVRKKKREELGFGEELKGDYNKKQLEMLSKILDDGKIVSEEYEALDEKLKKKLQESGDYDRLHYETDPNKQFNFSKGGIVPGNMMSGDKINAGVNSREMILNPRQQTNLFNMINSTVGSVVKPNIDAFQKPLSVAPSLSSQQAQASQKIELSPLKIDINGTIKLSGKGGDVDITKDLLNDKTFIKSITDAIVKQVNINDNTRYLADKR